MGPFYHFGGSFLGDGDGDGDGIARAGAEGVVESSTTMRAHVYFAVSGQMASRT